MDKPLKPRPPYAITSVDHALQLAAILQLEGRLTVSEAAARIDVARSTAHRLLAMLAHHRFVTQDAGRTYRAGPALVEVGLAAVRRLDVRAACRPLLEAVAQETGETVHCGVLDGTTIRYVDAVESSRVLRVTGRTGMVLPAHCSAAGKALLARLDPDELRSRYPEERLVQLTPRSIATFTELARMLGRVRTAGYAVNRHESEDGVAAVAVAVADEARSPIAAISCAAPVGRMDRARITEVGALMTSLVGGR